MKTYQDFCNQVSDKLFKLIEDNGSLLKWKRTWQVKGSQALPFSQSGFYHGGNLFSLLLAQVENGFTCNKWMTFHQTQQQGGSVLKGAKSEMVYFWKPIKRFEEVNGKKEEKTIPIFKTYRVFNIAQTSLDTNADQRDEQNISIMETLRKHNVSLSFFGNQPRYQPDDDVIVMPSIESFDSLEDYHTTLLHELLHWTGHASRLDRYSLGLSDTKHRAEEELVAEIGSVFLSTHFGIEGNLFNHASYVASWKEHLTAKDVMRAVNNAAKVFEYIIS